MPAFTPLKRINSMAHGGIQSTYNKEISQILNFLRTCILNSSAYLINFIFVITKKKEKRSKWKSWTN